MNRARSGKVFPATATDTTNLPNLSGGAGVSGLTVVGLVAASGVTEEVGLVAVSGATVVVVVSGGTDSSPVRVARVSGPLLSVAFR